MRFCSVATEAELPHLRVLASGLAEHHPGARLIVATLAGAMNDEPFETLALEELEVPGAARLAAEGCWPDVAEVVRPHLLRRLVLEGAETVVYLDPTVDLHAPLEPVTRAVRDHPLVLAPRVLSELPTDGRSPKAADLRAAGRLNGALTAVNRAALEPLEWWIERVSPGERTSARPGRWFQLAPSIFPRSCLLADPGCGLSYWNSHQFRLMREDGALTVGGRRLRYVDFEGFDPARPFLLAPGADRTRLSADPLLGELCDSYAHRLGEAGWRDLRRRRDVGRALPNGMTFDDRLSRLHANALTAGAQLGDVFAEDGCEAFMCWVAGPAPVGADHGVNRYLFEVYGERDDVARAYPDLEGLDGRGFAGWCWVFGAHEMGIPDDFLPPRPAGIALPQRRTDCTDREGPPQRLPRGPRPRPAVNVVGLLRGTLGLGEAARGYVRAFDTIGVPVGTATVELRTLVGAGAPAHDEGYGLVDYADLEAVDGGFNLVCINADELPRFAESVGEGFFRERPTVGVWAWETDRIPDRWTDAFALVDELWVYSTYVAANLARVAPVPVRAIPPPVIAPDPGDVELDLDLPPGFRFLFMFDFFSTIQRKNPVGLIEAFREAFRPGEGPQLVVKTINGRHRFEALEEVLWAARGRSDVQVIDRSLRPRERDALVAGCDCYVSLHRSEGFGLTLAECMALEKPVIGTAFSGTVDFMTDENSYLVPFGMTTVGADCDIYPADGTWADPDLAAAAQLMRRVVEQPEEAHTKGARARGDVERLLSPAAIGARARARLEELARLWD
jgi:glycosyltransferase involved in cell wall biosynthesis